MLRSVTTNVNEWNKHCTSSNTAGCPDELMVHSSSRVIHTCPLAWRTLFLCYKPLTLISRFWSYLIRECKQDISY